MPRRDRHAWISGVSRGAAVLAGVAWGVGLVVGLTGYDDMGAVCILSGVALAATALAVEGLRAYVAQRFGPNAPYRPRPYTAPNAPPGILQEGAVNERDIPIPDADPKKQLGPNSLQGEIKQEPISFPDLIASVGGAKPQAADVILIRDTAARIEAAAMEALVDEPVPVSVPTTTTRVETAAVEAVVVELTPLPDLVPPAADAEPQEADPVLVPDTVARVEVLAVETLVIEPVPVPDIIQPPTDHKLQAADSVAVPRTTMLVAAPVAESQIDETESWMLADQDDMK